MESAQCKKTKHYIIFCQWCELYFKVCK